jgi:hypothetical protein
MGLLTVHPIVVPMIMIPRRNTERFGFFDDWFNGNNYNEQKNKNKDKDSNNLLKGLNEVELLSLNEKNTSSREEIDSLNDVKETDFIQEVEKRKFATEKKIASVISEEEETREFDGYALRDAIYTKWGCCYDLEFQKVETFGFRNVYLNVMPFKLGGRKFRHRTELDYLMHLQAIVEILEKYGQLDYVLSQIETTDKTPRGNTSPLVAVPLRLDLSENELNSILNRRGF